LTGGSWAGQSQQGSSGLGDQLSAYFNPAARQKQEMETGMSQFYVIQLKDANTMIPSLREEVD